jgi:hypothetical protein
MCSIVLSVFAASREQISYNQGNVGSLAAAVIMDFHLVNSIPLHRNFLSHANEAQPASLSQTAAG